VRDVISNRFVAACTGRSPRATRACRVAPTAGTRRAPYLAGGMTEDHLLDDFPDLTRVDIRPAASEVQENTVVMFFCSKS
jgi:hypothetical protein